MSDLSLMSPKADERANPQGCISARAEIFCWPLKCPAHPIADIRGMTHVINFTETRCSVPRVDDTPPHILQTYAHYMNSTSEFLNADFFGKPFPKQLVKLLANREVPVSELHKYCMFALGHCLEHGDTGFALRLLEMLGRQNSTKRQVAAWFCTFGNFTVREGRLKFRKRSDMKSGDPVDWLTKANAAPFYTLNLTLPKGARLFIKQVGIATKQSVCEPRRSNSIYTISGGLPSLGRRR